MHPVILFDARKPGDLERAQRAGFDFLDYCVSIGGSITGEHGVGMEKMEMLGRQYSPASLDLMRRIKRTFDPLGLLNPGKMFPTGRGCAELRQPPIVNPSTLPAG
jgi:glycolate oxidase